MADWTIRLIISAIVQDIPTLDGREKTLWQQAMQGRLTQMFRHASNAARRGRKWFPEMWRHGGVDEEEDDDEDAVAAGGAEDPPQTEPQAKPPSLAEGGHATTPTNSPSSESWFDAQFHIHLGRDMY